MGTIRTQFSKPSSTPLSIPTTTTLPSSSSISLTETVNGSHEFKINGYSLLKGMGIGKYLASDTFMIGGYGWAIYFYPDGKSPQDNAAYVSLFIGLASEGTDVRALFELRLIDQSGKERHEIHSHFGRPLETGPYSLKHRGSMWGYKRFFKRTRLETSDYLKDDSLVFCCSVGVVKSQTEGPKSCSITIPPSNIGQQFGRLLENGIGSDVNFEVDGEKFSAHKLILASRSPVFKAQLFGPMKDHNTVCIKVEDMEAPIFKGICGAIHECTSGFGHLGVVPVLKPFQTPAKALLHFIYWDDLPDMVEYIGLGNKGASSLVRQHLLAAADRYALERLKLICEGKLCDDVAINTVATTLALAEQHQCTQLKAACLKFIASPENVKAVMQTDGFEYLKESCPSVITELLQYVARINEHCRIERGYGNELDGDVNGRRVKQRLH